LFAKSGWQDTKTELHLTGSYADNVLTGNGLQELRLLAANYSSVYTTPDTTTNRAAFVNVTARRSVTNQASVSMNGYVRHITSSTLNGDVNEQSLGENVYSPGENAANTPFPSTRCLSEVLARGEVDEKCTGRINRTSTGQTNYGASAQLNIRKNAGAAQNQVTVGGAFDRSSVSFGQTTQFGYVNAARGITPVEAFGDGVGLDGAVGTASVFATDTLSVARKWHVTLSGRLNHTRVSNEDLLTPAAGPGSLTGTDGFTRLNPAAGVTFEPSQSVNLYAGYSEGSRAPTSIELGCADPSTPCKLPNALAGDPPLRQVVTRTLEGGVRGRHDGINWNAGVFRATNADDLLFVASTHTGFCYFKNFGETRRQGVELGANARVGRVTLGAGYSLLDATYRTDETLASENNSANQRGVIEIHAGDRIPLVPRQTLKVYADVRATTKLSFDFDALAASSSIARGNENDSHQPDGLSYLGPGNTSAYAVLNAGIQYGLTKKLQLIAQAENLFNTRYYTAAQLGPTAFTATGTFAARPLPSIGGIFPVPRSTFYAPGAPVMWWAGVRVVL